MKIKDVINKYADSLSKVTEIPVLELKWYLSDRLDIEANNLLLYMDNELEQSVLDSVKLFVDRRLNYEPFSYITGEKEFMGLSFKVNSNVLIPRPDTEILVEKIINTYNQDNRLKALEIGVGSGAITVSLLKFMSNLKMDAVDISSDAIEVARQNASRHRVDDRLKLHVADLIHDKNQKYDFIVSNPPYIAEEEYFNLDKNVLLYEPKLALYADANGLDFYQRISKELFDNLKIGGKIFYEIGYNQAQSVVEILKDNKYSNITVVKDYGSKDRVVIAEKR